MSEKWLPVVGFEGWYEVSDEGRVRSLDRIQEIPKAHRPGELTKRLKRGRVLQPWPTRGGYLVVSLRSPDNSKAARLGGVVCRAFHGPPPTDSHETAHGDGVRTNNRACNVRWATKSENSLDKRRHGTHHGGVSGSRLFDAKTVAAIRELRASGQSMNQIARLHGCSWDAIKTALNSGARERIAG